MSETPDDWSSMELARELEAAAARIWPLLDHYAKNDPDGIADLHKRLTDLRQLADELDTAIVLDARESGEEWGTIAAATLAATKQAAHARYARRIARMQRLRDTAAARLAGQVPLDLKEPVAPQRPLDLPQT